MVLASEDIVDETLPPLASHRQTSQVPKSMNHIQFNIPNTVIGSDTSYYPQCPKLDTPPHHQLLWGEGVLCFVQQGDHPQQGPTTKQVELDGSAWTQAVLTCMRAGILFGEPYTVPISSNPTSKRVGWFVYIEHPVIPGFLPVYWCRNSGSICSLLLYRLTPSHFYLEVFMDWLHRSLDLIGT
jgi:hypothetical protein